MTSIDKIFPDYYKRFKLPIGAHEESIKVYRACRSGKCDKDSFLTTFEENGFLVVDGVDTTDPSNYSMSTYENPKDVKRFAKLNSDMQVPYRIAIGYTNPIHGLVQRAREKNKKSKSSHVDWWLYKNATPWIEFNLIHDFDNYLIRYKERIK